MGHSVCILFVGGCIKPGRIYVQNRVLCNFYNRLMYFNEKARHVFVFPGQKKQEFEMSMNSFFGVDGSMDENLVTQPAENKKKRGLLEEVDHASFVKELVKEIVVQMKNGYKLQVGLVK